MRFDRHNGFISEPERIKLLNWFDENVDNTNVFKIGISEGKDYKLRRTTRRSHDVNFPKLIDNIFDRIIKHYGFKSYIKQTVGTGGVFAVATFPGGDTYLHTDPNAQGFAAVTFNILIQDAESGGQLSIGDPLEEKPLYEKELHCYAASEYQHKVSEVLGNLNRYILIFRLALPTVEWENQLFNNAI